MPKKNSTTTKLEDHEGRIRSRTPKGHFVVYVGSEMKRFVLPTSYLKNPLFQNLLDKAAEEYGFDNGNIILLPCDESSFRRLIAMLARSSSFNSTRINPS
ncbi:hypothetical protein H5410_033043 [Solanum commersonii]|uniref:SAUR family protein n=1 Tax=Solanum commersonii TaxID=4109 RepID=A0A9J5YMN6_SOLCO|nr:hypothetical protein H5410_033043 [Solanum commersonii]